jgi:hypothetical protein
VFKQMLSKDTLKEVVSTLMWAASCQHASLTAGAYRFESFAIARPLVLHGDPDKLSSESGDTSEKVRFD